MTETEWRSKGEQLYGNDVKNWEFVCPSCKLVMSFNNMQEHKEYLTGKRWEPVTECVGRYMDGIGCDWAAYGLFAGPGEILNDDGSHKVYVFNFSKDNQRP